MREVEQLHELAFQKNVRENKRVLLTLLEVKVDLSLVFPVLVDVGQLGLVDFNGVLAHLNRHLADLKSAGLAL